jgi:MFS family permease
MLGPLGLSYAQYVLLVATAFGAKVVALPAMGALAHRFGARRMLAWGGVAIIPLSSFWIVSENFYYLMCVQLVGGVAWAAYELAMFLLFFETMPTEERTSLLTTFNLAHAVATATGSLVGGAILYSWGPHKNVYLALFALSAICRAVGLLVLSLVPKSSTFGEAVSMRTLSVRAGAGSLDQPILPSLGAEPPDDDEVD